jgi:hypothetical protein
LTIVQAPEVPANPVKRHLLLKLLVAIGVTASLMSALAVLQERAQFGTSSTEEETAAFTKLRGEALRDLRRWNPLAKRSATLE